MKFNIGDTTIYFPYPYVYPEQYEYMKELKHALESHGHGIIEMPTGTGKTVTILSFIMSYQIAQPDVGKLIYCTRTVGEMTKVMAELERVVAYRNKCLDEENVDISKAKRGVIAVGLTTRRNLCLHPDVSMADSREEADSMCRSLTASWARSAAIERSDGSGVCEYYEGYRSEGSDAVLPPGFYDIDRLMEFGKQRKWCPYYTARHALNFANVVVYNYQYLLDPKIAGLISNQLARESIVVFDEAHNIDNVCIDALSVNLRKDTLGKCNGNLTTLSNKISDYKARDAARLREEYERLVRGISTTLIEQRTEQTMGESGVSELLGAPVLPQDIVEETVPGNIRRAEHFISFLRRIVEYLREKMTIQHVFQENPKLFLNQMQNTLMTDAKSLRFCSERLKSLVTTLEVENLSEMTPLQLVADFATLLGTYGRSDNFAIIFEPTDHSNIPDPLLQLACLDASLGIKPVFARFQTVILTSGTISPLNLYSKILGFSPIVARSLSMSMERKCICPMIVSRGPDQVSMTSKFISRDDLSVVRNYGNLVIELATHVPDGMVVFFTSYVYMELMISYWDEMNVINRILDKKLVFIETPDITESSLALDNYRRACDCGRGAVFLCVARGKVAEGIDFDGHYGRAVVVIGVPFQYTESRVLRARLEYMRLALQIRESDYLSFDAMRQASQCIGRVIRSKSDYGIMVLADKRFVRNEKRGKLPPWILDCLEDAHVDMDTDEAVGTARRFLKDLAQPTQKSTALGIALLTGHEVAKLESGKALPKLRLNELQKVTTGAFVE
uniref:DNA 5'-3' helicase n=1 Tax=Rhodosorus marinus TaxID=101924 RepID=A0A7S0BFL7_9RHOD|mmetsp:Transcript_14286/g.20786  ORF Transcript_14286/g.20786 Transcript_14286/m.20786 type:complete len:789 (+) Transcript_14286:71-2437(+)